MCGICGEVNFNQRPVSTGALTQMTEVLAPRGPDSEGLIVRGRWGLGHRRLKIIDLSARSEQPMSDPDLGLSGVFNGCIYNYRELRQELEAKGYSWLESEVAASS